MSSSGGLRDDELVSPEHRPDPRSRANADANAASLELPDRLASRIRAHERAGTDQPFRHRIALIGAAKLDLRRPIRLRSGVWQLLEAVYAHGKPHWLDPVHALAPVRELLFNEQAPPGTDRGIYYVLTRLARAGISPAAFASHVVVPRLARDADWRHWRVRHIWVLDAIADMLIELKDAPPWNEPTIGGGLALSDVALCKYAGRPLCRLSGSRMESQATHLAAWMAAWKSFRFSDDRFLSFLRRSVLPCLYRLSGRVDPEQLAPLAHTLAGMERSLGARLSAMGAPAARSCIEEEGFADRLDARLDRHAGADGYYGLVRELRAWLDVVTALSKLDSGPALIGLAGELSMASDTGYFSDAAALLSVLRRVEGVSVPRWHLQSLARLGPLERSAFIEETRMAKGVHPTCPGRPPEAEAYWSGTATLAEALSIPDVAAFRPPGGVRALVRVHGARFPEYGALMDRLLCDIGEGRDAGWTRDTLASWDSAGPAFHELAMRQLFPGLNLAAAAPSSRSFGSLWAGRPSAAQSHGWTNISVACDADGAAVPPAVADAIRTKLETGAFDALVAALSGDDQASGALFARLGKELADARKNLDGGAGFGAQAGTRRLAVLSAVMDASELVSPVAGDARRLVLALLASAWLLPAGDPDALRAVAATASRFADRPAIHDTVASLKADCEPGYPGAMHAALALETVDELARAMRGDERLVAALASRELAEVLAVSGKAGDAHARLAGALRQCAGYRDRALDLARWRDLAALRSAGPETRRVAFRAMHVGSPLDLYAGAMAGELTGLKPATSSVVIRLWDSGARRFAGASLLSAGPEPGSPYFLRLLGLQTATARRLGSRELAAVYLAYRSVAERVSEASGRAILVPTRAASLAGEPAMASLAVRYETAGDPESDSGWLRAIDPARPDSFRATRELETLGAWRP